jgi:hypothetical protein
MRFGVQRQQTLLVTTELVIWCYANAFIFTNQSELDFGIAYVLYIQFIVSRTPITVVPKLCSADPKRSGTSSQGIYGYVSVTATLKFDVVLKVMAEFL